LLRKFDPFATNYRWNDNLDTKLIASVKASKNTQKEVYT